MRCFTAQDNARLVASNKGHISWTLKQPLNPSTALNPGQQPHIHADACHVHHSLVHFAGICGCHETPYLTHTHTCWQSTRSSASHYDVTRSPTSATSVYCTSVSPSQALLAPELEYPTGPYVPALPVARCSSSAHFCSATGILRLRGQRVLSSLSTILWASQECHCHACDHAQCGIQANSE